MQRFAKESEKDVEENIMKTLRQNNEKLDKLHKETFFFFFLVPCKHLQFINSIANLLLWYLTTRESSGEPGFSCVKRCPGMYICIIVYRYWDALLGLTSQENWAGHAPTGVLLLISVIAYGCWDDSLCVSSQSGLSWSCTLECRTMHDLSGELSWSCTEWYPGVHVMFCFIWT